MTEAGPPHVGDGPVETPDGGTPLTEEKRRGLIVPALNRRELNAAEAANMNTAVAWVFLSRNRPRASRIADEIWLRGLHKRMFGQVWSWAGQYRTEDRNIGVPFWNVRVEMRVLVADCRTWLADESTSAYGPDETAIRFAYRLVAIHPFPNGNGRWSRLVGDALVVSLGRPRFTWGGQSLDETSQLRQRYVAALQVADSVGDLEPLLNFARS